MNRVSSLHRRALLPRVLALVVVGLLAFVLAGCDWGQPNGLSVDGQHVSMAQLFKEFDALSAVNPSFKASNGKYTTTQVSTYLTSRIQGLLIHEEFERRHLKVTPAQRTQAKSELVASLAGASSSSSSSSDAAKAAQATFNKLPGWFQDQLVDTTAEQLALQESFSSSGPSLDQEARQIYNATKGQYDQYCLSAIATNDKASADAAKKRVDNGEDFATVAKEVSVDPSKDQGGSIGCTSLGTLSNALGTNLPKAKVGDVLGPVSYGTGYVILKVTSVKPQTFEDVKAEIEQSLPTPGAQQLNTLIAKKLKSADVSVNPRFGSWTTAGTSSDSGPHIQAPKGAESGPTSATPLATLPAGAAAS